jgi:hypothetical protein
MAKAERLRWIALPEKQAQSQVDERVTKRGHFPIQYTDKARLCSPDQAIVQVEIAMDKACMRTFRLVIQQPARDLVKQRQLAHFVGMSLIKPTGHLTPDEAFWMAKLLWKTAPHIRLVHQGQAADHLTAQFADNIAIGPDGCSISIREICAERNAVEPFDNRKALAKNGAVIAPSDWSRHGCLPMKRLERGIFARNASSRAVGNGMDGWMPQDEAAIVALN